MVLWIEPEILRDGGYGTAVVARRFLDECYLPLKSPFPLS